MASQFSEFFSKILKFVKDFCFYLGDVCLGFRKLFEFYVADGSFEADDFEVAHVFLDYF